MKSAPQLNHILAPGKFGGIIAVSLYLLIAVVIAYWIGSGATALLILCLMLTVVCFVTFGLQRSAWVLIPLAWMWSGSTGVLPFSLSLRDAAVLLAACAYFCYLIVGHQTANLRTTFVDGVLWVNIFYVGMTFLIHPVGFRVFNSDLIGGRPYISVALAVIAYHVLVRAPESGRSLGRVPIYLLIGSGVYTFLYFVSYFFPSLPMHVPLLFGALDIGLFNPNLVVESGIRRFEWLGSFGLLLTIVLGSYYSPRQLLNPLRWRFWYFLIALICVLAAGYRNIMLWALAALILASWLRHGWGEVMLFSVCAAVFFGLLVMGQGRFYELPKPAQRSLAFIPGKWDPMVVEDVENSSEGRFQWWRDIIKNHMIKNWWVGDGFGAKAADLQSIAMHGDYAEFIMNTGAYHSGPLTAIRFVGVIGLILLYFLMFAMAICAVQFTRRCAGTDLYPIAIFIAIQCVWIPVDYTFIFGAYDSQLPQQIFLAALLRAVIRFQDERAKGINKPGSSGCQNANPANGLMVFTAPPIWR